MACELEDQSLMLAKMVKAQSAAVKATADAADVLATVALEVAQTASNLCHGNAGVMRTMKKQKAAQLKAQAIMACMNAYAKEMAKLVK